MRNPTYVTTAVIGSLVGLIGIEHGVGEILQGNTAPADWIFPSWPEAPFFAILGGEPAASIVPNLLVTGILAVLLSLAYIGWAVCRSQRRYGGLGLIALAVLLFLFGGGIFPPVLGALVGAIATRTRAPKTGVTSTRGFLYRAWPWSVGGYVVSSLLLLPGVPLLNALYGVGNPVPIVLLVGCMFGSLFLAWVSLPHRQV